MSSKNQIIKGIENYDLRFIDGDLHIIPRVIIKNEIDDNDIKSSTILKVKIDGELCEIKNYSPLLSFLIEKIKVDKEVNVKDIIDKIGFNFKIGEYTLEGFHYKEELGISIQYKDGYNTFKAIEKLVKEYEYKLTLKLKTKTSKIVKCAF